MSFLSLYHSSAYLGHIDDTDCGDETRITDPEIEVLEIVLVGTLIGHVYEDINGNGAQEEGEPNLSEVAIELKNSNGIVVQTLTSDMNGNYKAELPPGVIAVDIDKTSLLADFVQTEGDDPTKVTVPPGRVVSTIDGFQRQCLLEGHIYEDENGNGAQDEFEINLVSVQVRIIDSNERTLQTLVTDTNGDYNTRLPPGNVTVQVDHSTLPFERIKQSQGQDPTKVTLVAGGISSLINGFRGIPRSNDDTDVRIDTSLLTHLLGSPLQSHDDKEH